MLYREVDSPLHRLGAGPKLAVSALLAATAIALPRPAVQIALLAGLVVGYRVAKLRPAEFWEDARWLLVQAALIFAIALLLQGTTHIDRTLGAIATIGIAFLAGSLVLRTTSTARFVATLQRWLPDRLAFGVATSLRFLPLFVREAHEIAAAQRLRGARLEVRDLWRPVAWRDWVECVGVPLAVRMIRVADQAALAAEIRGLGEREPSP